MAKLRIEESFELPAPPDRVWAWLIAPERIVGCLPGATLEEQESEDTYAGRMTVKLGAVTVVYAGTAVFEDVDPDARRLRITADGRERGGSGSARMTMTGLVEALPDGGSRTSVEADVEISGKMVRFGRGMIERVAAEVFRDFSVCLAERLSAEGSPGGSGGDAESEGEPDAEAPGGTERTFRLGPVLITVFVGWLSDLVDRLRGKRGDADT